MSKFQERVAGERESDRRANPFRDVYDTFDELCERATIVRELRGELSDLEVLAELVQIAAMAERAAVDLELIGG